MPDTFQNRLNQAISMREIKPADLAKTTGLSKAQISQYTNGIYEAKQVALHKLAIALNVSEAWLMGHDVSSEREQEFLSFDNIFPIHKKKFPLLGEIACGQPIFADEDRESYVEAGTNINADFCLKAKGDSMINARILDGDIVFIRKQEMVDDGEIAAVIIGDEATLKRVYYNRQAGILQLVAENPAFAPLVYSGEELNQIRILGKAVAFQSDVR